MIRRVAPLAGATLLAVAAQIAAALLLLPVISERL
jgi:hypothetical protein